MFPEKIKIAIVKPLYKKGDIYNVENYRPISVLSLFSKILETMYNRLKVFETIYNMLTEGQNGFTEKKSTDTAIQSYIVKVHKALDSG
jgi:hypothetical protein